MKNTIKLNGETFELHCSYQRKLLHEAILFLFACDAPGRNIPLPYEIATEPDKDWKEDAMEREDGKAYIEIALRNEKVLDELHQAIDDMDAEKVVGLMHKLETLNDEGFWKFEIEALELDEECKCDEEVRIEVVTSLRNIVYKLNNGFSVMALEEVEEDGFITFYIKYSGYEWKEYATIELGIWVDSEDVLSYHLMKFVETLCDEDFEQYKEEYHVDENE